MLPMRSGSALRTNVCGESYPSRSLLWVTVTVVHVRSMRMIVRRRCMAVKARMRLGCRFSTALVDAVVVVIIVSVAVFVHELRMVVCMPMRLGQ